MSPSNTAHLALRYIARPRALTTLALALSLSMGAIGCVAGVSSTPPRGVVVSGPPPAPLGESRPPPPSPSAAWVAGYWHWNGSTYSWIPGHWENAPPGMIWYGPTYNATADGRTVYQPGAFRPGGPMPRNVPPSTPANANALR